MAVVSPSRYKYFWDLYEKGLLAISGAQVKVSGLAVSASASILSVNAVAGGNYEDLIVDFVVTFNTTVGGRLEEITINVRGPTLKNVTPVLVFCSSENMPVPSGTVKVTKRFIVRWYMG